MLAPRFYSLLLIGLGIVVITFPFGTLDVGRAKASQIAASGGATAGEGAATPKVASGAALSEIPPPPAGEAQDHHHPDVPVRQGEVWQAIPSPTDPPTPVVQETASTLTPQAATDFSYQIVHDLTSAESPSRSTVHEPSIASMGNTIFMTANWYASRSTDAGNTFTYVSPYSTFPSINGGFCCDQIANCSPVQNMMLWALQYIKDANSGTLRIARAVGPAQVASNTWVYYDFNPQSFGFANGNWMDFPNLTVSANFLYASSNVFRTSDDFFTGSVVFRIPLSQLAAGGAINFSYFAGTDVGSPRCTEGAGTTMYWATFSTTSQLRIHRWEDSSSTILWDDIDLAPFTFLSRDGVAISPDGTNWAARASTRVLGAWVAGGILGFMWHAKQDTTFPYPYTIVARFSEATRAVVSQNQVWNTDNAWLYPTASVNAAGNLAGLLAYGGGPYYPGTNIWISDDVQSGFSPVTLYGLTGSTDGPNRNVWGDYITARPQKDFPNSWVAATFWMGLGGDNEDTVATYVWFGRERDLPPPCATPAISVGQTVLGSLVTSDCRSPSRGLAFYADRRSFNAAAGQRVSVSLSSTAFDTYLYLIGTNGAIISQDDDGGTGSDSRIPPMSGVITLPSSGTYTVEATSFAVSTTGAYTLKLRGFDTDGDGIPDDVELVEGTNPDVKDNDIFSSARLFVMQQYRDFLGREGDSSGITFWTNRINSGASSRAQVVDSFFNSAEFQNTTAPITRLYFAYFLRIPDYGGLLFWVGQFRSGVPLTTISESFAQSAEFISRYGGLNNTQFVTLVYNNVLGRAPDSGGLAFWVGQLNSGAMTRGRVMLEFSESAEYRSNIFNEVFVTQIYIGMLRRVPDQGGFDFWVGRLDGGASGLDLIGGFLASTEYRNRFLPPV